MFRHCVAARRGGGIPGWCRVDGFREDRPKVCMYAVAVCMVDPDACMTRGNKFNYVGRGKRGVDNSEHRIAVNVIPSGVVDAGHRGGGGARRCDSARRL